MIRDPVSRFGSLRVWLAAAASIVSVAGAPAMAQTLDFPASVCPGDEFEVEWTGPNDAGDQLAVAVSQRPADEFLDSAATADGDPAVLRAPFQPGTYDVRYVRNEPLGILVKEDLIVDPCPSGSNEEWYPPIALEVRGTLFDYGDKINRSYQGPYGPAGYTIDDLCNASDAIGAALQMMVYEAESGLAQSGSPVTLDMVESLPGVPTRAEIERDLATARDAICDDRPPRLVVQPFVVTYAWCRMAMYTPTHAMDIHLPPGTGDGAMSAADHTTREVVTMTLRRNIEALEATIGPGWGADINMTATGRTGPRIGYATREYEFDYTGGPGGAGPMQAISDLVKVRNKGTAWISNRVPGIDIVRLFYQRMAAEVQADSGAMSFFGGLINNMLGMLRKGLPLEIDQTVSSSVAGARMVSGRSRHVLTGTRMFQFDPEWCIESLMPDGYAVTDVDQQLAEAMGASGTSPDEMAAAMAEYNQAMEQMTPEQRAMMESMGMGQMMQQAGAAGAMAGSAPSGAAPAARSLPSSAELTTNDLAQSVQNHLEALGYDTGNTSGEVSLETTIAISQFQAEKGLEVTGEVTPQLLGVLAAEVDGRR